MLTAVYERESEEFNAVGGASRGPDRCSSPARQSLTTVSRNTDLETGHLQDSDRVKSLSDPSSGAPRPRAPETVQGVAAIPPQRSNPFKE
jgi:hypothetical protein